MSYSKSICVFLSLMLIVFIVDYFFINRRKLKIILNNGQTKKGKKKKVKPIGEIDNFLVPKFKLDKSKLNLKTLIIYISFINSFIIAFVSTIIMLLDLKTIWLLIIAFILLFSLVYALYELLGRFLKKKEGK